MVKKVSQEEMLEFLTKTQEQTAKSWNEILTALSKVPFYREVVDKTLLLQKKEPTILN